MLTAPERWLLEPQIVRKALADCRLSCTLESCPNKDKPTAMCAHFWALYPKLYLDTIAQAEIE